MKITSYSIHADIPEKIEIALIADLHNRPINKITNALSSQKPDIIAIAGDLANKGMPASQNAVNLLKFCAGIAPTFYSLGNHERFINKEDRRIISKTGAVLLDNDSVKIKGITIGGLSSGFKGQKDLSLRKYFVPNLNWLKSFAELGDYKILLCHHPEYYDKYIKNLNIDLILSGHAHGGQIRIFGQGLFSPGQGIFPKYTSGIYDGRLLVSRGLSNTAKFIPRLWNETELVYITLK